MRKHELCTGSRIDRDHPELKGKRVYGARQLSAPVDLAQRCVGTVDKGHLEAAPPSGGYRTHGRRPLASPMDGERPTRAVPELVHRRLLELERSIQRCEVCSLLLGSDDEGRVATVIVVDDGTIPSLFENTSGEIGDDELSEDVLDDSHTPELPGGRRGHPSSGGVVADDCCPGVAGLKQRPVGPAQARFVGLPRPERRYGWVMGLSRIDERQAHGLDSGSRSRSAQLILNPAGGPTVALSLLLVWTVACGAPGVTIVDAERGTRAYLELETPHRDRVRDLVTVRRMLPRRPVRADGHAVETLGRRFGIRDLPRGEYTIEVRPAEETQSDERPICRGWDVDLESEQSSLLGGCGDEHDLRQLASGPLLFTVTEEDAHRRRDPGSACGDYVVTVRRGVPSCFER